MNGRHLSLLTLLTVTACLYAAWSPADEPAKAEKPAADSMLGKEAGDVRDDNGLKMKMVWCPPGSFTMGPTFGPNAAHVFLSRGYWLGKYEVTQAEWKQVMQTDPWKQALRVKGENLTKEGDDFPASNVTWHDAMEFCRQLTDLERKAGRLPVGWEYTLPTNAQWERACRARTETAFSFGDDESKLGEYAWFLDNASKAGERWAHQVGQKKPNPWGLHDMYGNVGEWCRDSYGERPPGGGRDPEVKEESSQRMTRGGNWADPGSFCRRVIVGYSMVERNAGLGFRVALSPVQPAK